MGDNNGNASKYRRLFRPAVAFVLTLCLMGTSAVPTLARDNSVGKSGKSPRVAENPNLVKNLKKVPAGAKEISVKPKEIPAESKEISDEEKVEALTVNPQEGEEYDGYIVGLKENKEDEIDQRAANEYTSSPDEDIYVVDKPGDSLKFADPEIIEYIEPNYKKELLAFPEDGIPDDPLYDQQWALDTVNAAEAWKNGFSGDGVKVGVLDTGINPAHEDLDGVLYTYKDFYDYPNNTNAAITDGHSGGHGTRVAGYIGAETNNTLGVAAPAYGVSLAMLKIGDSKGDIWTDDYVAALQYAQTLDLDVINLSIGGTEYSMSEYEALKVLTDDDVVVIAANGNEGNKGSPLSYPAGYSNVVGVGCIKYGGTLNPGSNQNSSVDVAAPGDSAYSTLHTTSGAYSNSGWGTSYASPVVAAAAALAKEIEPNLTPEQFMTLLLGTSKEAGRTGWDEGFGAGILDIGALTSKAAVSTSTEATYSVAYNTMGGEILDTHYGKYFEAGEAADVVLPTNLNGGDYEFAGWYDNEEYTGEPMEKLPSTLNRNIELYALWIPPDILNMKNVPEDESHVYLFKEEGFIWAGLPNLGSTFDIIAMSKEDSPLTISGTAIDKSIWIGNGDDENNGSEDEFDIEINNLNMDLPNLTDSAILVNGLATVNLTVTGTNTLSSPIPGNPCSPLEVYTGAANLNISGTGVLNVSSAGYAAGIGTEISWEDAIARGGNIVISGATVNADSAYGAGIGAAGTPFDIESPLNSIRIEGGYITAKGGTADSSADNDLADIGTSHSGEDGQVIIEGGSVLAVNDNISPAPVDSSGSDVYKVTVPAMGLRGVPLDKRLAVNVPLNTAGAYKATTVSSSQTGEHGNIPGVSAYIYLPVGGYENIQIGEYGGALADVVKTSEITSPDQNRVYWITITQLPPPPQVTYAAYTVFFNPRGGKVGTASKTVPPDGKYGTLPTPKRKNYTFTGWYTAANGGSKITSNTNVSVASNIYLYAHWKKSPRYAVTFNPNRGKVGKKKKTVVRGEKYGTLPKAKRKGKKFKGWYTKRKGGKRITKNSTVNLKKRTTLYAHWGR